MSTPSTPETIMVTLEISAKEGSTWTAADLATLQAIPDVMNPSLDGTSTLLSAQSTQTMARVVATNFAKAFPGFGVKWASLLPPGAH